MEPTCALLQSLNNQIASKDEDLQAHCERYNAKDEQIAGMAQQVEQLESCLEEQRQKEVVRQAHDRHDWAVDVSLDQGMGLSSAPLMPSSSRALRQRMLVLEVSKPTQTADLLLMPCYRLQQDSACMCCQG